MILLIGIILYLIALITVWVVFRRSKKLNKMLIVGLLFMLIGIVTFSMDYFTIYISKTSSRIPDFNPFDSVGGDGFWRWNAIVTPTVIFFIGLWFAFSEVFRQKKKH